MSSKGETASSSKGQENTVFISYAREDFEAAKKLVQDLKRAGLNTWLDKDSLIPGKNWKVSIKDAIKSSRYFIPLFSSVSVAKRGYVQREFKYALEVFDEIPESQIFVIPVRLDNCEIPYDKLNDIEYVDLFPAWKEGEKKILKAMGIKPSLSFSKYANKTFGIEISYPFDWDVKHDTDHISFISPVEDDSDVFLERLSIYVIPNIREAVNDATLNEIFYEYRKGDKSYYKDYELLENKRIKLDGLEHLPVNKEMFQYSDDNQKIRVLAYKIINSGSLYNILFYALADSFDNYLPIVQNMIDSLRFSM